MAERDKTLSPTALQLAAALDGELPAVQQPVAEDSPLDFGFIEKNAALLDKISAGINVNADYDFSGQSAVEKTASSDADGSSVSDVASKALGALVDSATEAMENAVAQSIIKLAKSTKMDAETETDDESDEQASDSNSEADAKKSAADRALSIITRKGSEGGGNKPSKTVEDRAGTNDMGGDNVATSALTRLTKQEAQPDARG